MFSTFDGKKSECSRNSRMLLELPVGANQEKKSVAMANLSHMMDTGHAVRCPGPAALDIAWVGAGAADCYFHFG